MPKYYLRHSSPRASVRCWFGPVSAGFAVLSAGQEKKMIMREKREEKKDEEKKIKTPRKGSPSYALNNTTTRLFLTSASGACKAASNEAPKPKHCFRTAPCDPI